MFDCHGRFESASKFLRYCRRNHALRQAFENIVGDVHTLPIEPVMNDECIARGGGGTLSTQRCYVPLIPSLRVSLTARVILAMSVLLTALHILVECDISDK